jgi:hypothetical protein
MPHADLSAFGNHGITAVTAFANKARLSLLPIIPLDNSKLHHWPYLPAVCPKRNFESGQSKKLMLSTWFIRLVTSQVKVDYES